jgi:hypothetical protein
MQHGLFSAKISYVCIFQKTVNEASANLIRLILNEDPGFEEGITVWQNVIVDYLQSPDELIELNQWGITFSIAEWSQILQQVLMALMAHQKAVS